jgi:two-component system, cell cycle sensor histidine kinase and response regulator CckA
MKKADKEIVLKKEKGKILVMDDQLKIIKSTKKMLSYLGYTVSTAKDGNEAMTLYKKAYKTKKPYDIVLMDLTIPGGMGGKETAEKILNIDKKACLIITSGYSNDSVIANYEKFGFKDVIIKPFTIEKLVEKIKKNINK